MGERRERKKIKVKKVRSEQVVGGREDDGGKGLRGGGSSEGRIGTNGPRGLEGHASGYGAFNHKAWFPW